MEEKKAIKTSLSTFFLILAIIAICVMGVYIYRLNDDKMKSTDQVSQLNNQINSLENTVNSLQKKIENTSNTQEQTQIVSNTSTVENNTTANNITNTTDIENLLKNKENYEYLKIKNIKEDGDKYLIEADYYVPTPITENEYSEMVKNKKITLRNKEYIFENSDKTYNPGYGYIYTQGEVAESGYWIEKSKGGYIFIHEIGGVYNIINEIKGQYKFYLDKNTEVTEVAGSGDVVKLYNYLSKSENKNVNNFFAQVVYSKFYDNDNTELRVLVDKR